jgi:hypothetical protein
VEQYGDHVEQLTRWWMRSSGRQVRPARRGAELLDDSLFLVRWRGGEWTDRDGTFCTGDKLPA